MIFGVYPGGAAGASGEMADGPPDVPSTICIALDALQGDPRRSMSVRAYQVFSSGAPGPARSQSPADPSQYVADGRGLDLVAQYQSATGDIDGYCAFIRDLIDRYGNTLVSLQIGEEPNVNDNPVLDGAYPRVLEAVAEGVVTAKEHAQRCGLGLLPIGINSTVLFGPAEPFLSDLVAVGGRAMCDALDYVGLDIFPDVFRPVPADRLATITTALLGEHREHRLRPAGLGDVPLRITEHGWPTGPDRSPARQAEVLTIVVGVLVDNAAALNLDGYSHFSLRDADTARSGLFHRFGLMTDDYQPKPAFGVYRDLISRYAG